MKLQIKQRNVKLGSQEQDNIKRRFLFCFSRLSEVVKQVTLTLKDVNGPKGGEDKQCKVHVSFYRGKDLVLTENQSNFSQSINRALQRASYSASRHHKRKRIISHRSFNEYAELDSIENTTVNH